MTKKEFYRELPWTGNEMRKMRLDKMLSLNEQANELGINRQTLWRYESCGNNKPFCLYSFKEKFITIYDGGKNKHEKRGEKDYGKNQTV